MLFHVASVQVFNKLVKCNFIVYDIPIKKNLRSLVKHPQAGRAFNKNTSLLVLRPL